MRTPGGGVKIGYARVSTEDQNLDLQRMALMAAGCRHIFEDHGISGSTAKRPGLSQALATVQEGDVLVVWKLDRLGRSLRHLVGVLDDLGSSNIGFTSITENIDTTTAGGRLVFHMMAALAEFERSIIAERTKAGLHAAQKRGQRLGRPAKLTAENISYAQALITSGNHTRRAIAHRLGVDESTLRRALKR